MPHTLAFDWEADYLAGIDANVSGETVRVQKCFRLDWPDDADLRKQPGALGQWLANSLRAEGVTSEAAHVVLPREAIVVRKLDLPNAPDEELPDLVRFQAATKSSTSLDRLTLDYLPLPVQPGDATRQVLMVTVDRERLQLIRETLAAAQVELLTVGISPVAVSEVVAHIDRKTSPSDKATLVIFQDTHRVEMTALVERQVVFSHHTRLVGEGAKGGTASPVAEINRTIVALSQSLSDIEIGEVCFIHSGDVDPSVEEALRTRFEERLKVLDVSVANGVTLAGDVDASSLAAYAPALGALLSQVNRQIMSVDFLDPRRAIVPPDRTNLRRGIAAAAAVLLAGVGYWSFSSYLADLEAQTLDIEQQVADLDAELRQGTPDQNAAALIGEWVSRTRDPLSIIDQINRLAPGTDRLYLSDLNTQTLSREADVRITGTGYAVSQQDVEQLQEVLEEAGFEVLPAVPERSRRDPDYPFTFELQIDVPPVEETPRSDENELALN
ncbi:MAG: hypothetical protein KDA93_05900 [Planctomycetaceae bacterium]|nr:hypothetical protein [Planctomycetaceae bacterium]